MRLGGVVFGAAAVDSVVLLVAVLPDSDALLEIAVDDGLVPLDSAMQVCSAVCDSVVEGAGSWGGAGEQASRGGARQQEMVEFGRGGPEAR